MASIVKDDFANNLVGLWHICDVVVRDGLLTFLGCYGSRPDVVGGDRRDGLDPSP